MTRIAMRLARRWDRGRAPRLIVLVVVLGLLTPTVLRTLGPDGAAWLPDHGHIFLINEASMRPHTHPWDTHAPIPTDVTKTTAASGVLFTVGDLDATSSFAALALPVVALAAFAVAWAGDRVEALHLVRVGRRFAPLVPPPQG